MSTFLGSSEWMYQSDSGYKIDNSLRYRHAANPNLSKTFSSAGDRTTWTYSLWAKITTPELDTQCLLANSLTSDTISRSYNGSFSFYEISNNKYITTSFTGGTKYRDPSGWYHIVAVWDSSNATSTDRMRLYLNGERLPVSAPNGYPALNAVTGWNNNTAQYIGNTPAANAPMDGFITEIYFVDGQALDSTYFGEYNSNTGVWQPKAYEGSYGTNGFFLKDGRGTDQSGNGNDWTETNFNTSTSSADTYDISTDVPTLTSSSAANYCILNASDVGGEGGATNVTISQQSGLFVAGGTQGTSYGAGIRGSIAVNSGKWYYECVHSNYAGTGNNSAFGLMRTAAGPNLTPYTSNTTGGTPVIGLFHPYTSGGNLAFFNDTSTYSYHSTGTPGDQMGVAFEINGSSSKIWFSQNGQWWNSSYVLGSFDENSPTLTFTQSDNEYFSPWFHPMSGSGSANKSALTVNFGQRPFAYTPPTGFKELNTYNLPDSTIEDGSQHFDVQLWTGTGSDRDITGYEFQPDIFISRLRNYATNTAIFDVVRNSGLNTYSLTNTTAAEATVTWITSVNSDGISVTGGPTYLNSSGYTYVGWAWKTDNTSGSTNELGGITSTVSANTTSGVSIVTWTGVGAGANTVGHGLGVAPKFIITKTRDGSPAYNWNSYHYGIHPTAPEDYFVALDNNAARNPYTSADLWNRTQPTSTVFSVNHVAAAGGVGELMLAYCFAEVDGFSKFGSYVGNGSTSGPFINLGFRPRFLVVRRVTSTGNWQIFDSARDPYNPENSRLYFNLTDVESDQDSVDFLSNGFRCRDTSGDNNTSGQTYIYAAFAENPFKNALAR